MAKKQVKSYFKNTISFTLIFALVCAGIIASAWSNSVYQSRTEENSEELFSQKGYINTLLLGVDKDGYRTDVVIFAQLNLAQKSLSMLQIPRDTNVRTYESPRKINSFNTYKDGKTVVDINGVYNAVENLTGQKVDHYFMVNTKGFRDLIDAIGGVEFNVPRRMKYDDPDQDFHIDLQEGMQHLDGDKAEQLVRFRLNNDGTGYARGDLERNEVQRDFILAVIDKAFSISSVAKLPELISMLSSCVETNFTNAQMLQYAPILLSLDKENINIFGLEGVAEYIGPGSYFIPNSSLNQANFDKYFVDENTVADVSNSEMKLRDKLLSNENNTAVEADYSVSSASFFDKLFANIRIVDGSEGTADIDEIKSLITSLGYNTPDIYKADVSYPTSRIIAKEENKNAHLISQSLNFEDFIVSDSQTGDYQIVIVVGKNWNE